MTTHFQKIKIGDLVRYGPKMAAASNRVGLVVEVHDGFTAVVLWNGIKRKMVHRQNLLEVVSESR